MLLRFAVCRRAVIAVLITALLVLPVPRAAAALPPTDELGAVWIGPGTTYTTLELAGGRARGNMVRIDPAAGPVEIWPATPHGRLGARQPLSGQATSYGQRVIAAINGDFFYMTPDAPGAPIGLLVRAGELISSGSGPTVGIDTDGRPVFGTPKWTGRIEVIGPDGQVESSRQLCGVNKPRAADCLVLYTPLWGPSTRTNPWGSEAVIVPVDRQALPLRLRTSFEAVVSVPPEQAPGGNTELAGGTLVLSGHGAAGAFLRERLRSGTRVRIVLDIDDAWANVQHAMGGGPLLVAEGRPVPLPSDGSATRREPRTALGVDAQGRWIWVVIDGRRPGWSEGVTLVELATLMLEAGAVWAINLDGGGSTTMLIRPPGRFEPVLANRPSEPERAIGPAWLALSRALPGPAAHVWLSVSPSSDTPVLPQVPVEFRVLAQDANHEPVQPGGSQWEVEDSPRGGAAPLAEVQEGSGWLRVVPGGPGVVSVRADVGGQQAEAEVHVAGPDDIARVEIQPDPATLTPGATVQFTAVAFDAAGRPLPSVPASFIWSGTGDLDHIEESGRLRLPDGFARGEITVALRVQGTDGQPAARALRTVAVTVGEPPELPPPPSYADMDGHWAVDAVAALSRAGVVRGYPDGTFGPERSVTRAEFAVMLWRLLGGGGATGGAGGNGAGDNGTGGSGASGSSGTDASDGDGSQAQLPFTDAADIPDWAAAAVAEAARRGLLGGYEDGTFRPHRAISREEAAAILSRVPGGPAETGQAARFTDHDAIGEWALAAVESAARRGLIQGYPDGSFRPQGQITRAETAVILTRLMPDLTAGR